MKLVQELGEAAEPKPTVTASSDAPASSTDDAVTSSQSTEALRNQVKTSSEAESDEVATENIASSTPEQVEEEVNVTTAERQPMKIPDTIHVRVTPDNLKEYVGPPVYQKDRMYAKPPPPGVSTGLGYLGNGSGAVMPIEAMVCCLNSTQSDLVA